MQRYGSSSWHVQLLVSFTSGLSGHYQVSGLAVNSPPQIAKLPLFQHQTLKYGSNDVKTYALPVSDPDNNVIKCRWAANFTEGGGVWNSRIGTLHEVSAFFILNFIY